MERRTQSAERRTTPSVGKADTTLREGGKGYFSNLKFRQLVAPERGDVFDSSKTEGSYAKLKN